MEWNLGHHAWVLLNIDLADMLQESVLAERTGSSILASVVYENLPQFCSHCKAIGHEISHSRFNKFKKAEETSGLRKNNTQRVTQARSGDKKRRSGGSHRHQQLIPTASRGGETTDDTEWRKARGTIAEVRIARKATVNESGKCDGRQHARRR